MRIISDFRDYYDCIQAQDREKLPVWIRTPETTQYSKSANYPFPHIRTVYHMPIINKQCIIGFCGKIYPQLHLASDYFSRSIVCRTLQDVDEFVRTQLNEAANAQYRAKYPKRLDMLQRKHFEKFFTECEQQKEAYVGLMKGKYTPVFVAETPCRGWGREVFGEVTYNSTLRDLEFFRTFPPAQAYQEILMFMGGIAIPMKPIPKIDDKTMAEVKGFDKFSFRKDPIRKRRK